MLQAPLKFKFPVRILLFTNWWVRRVFAGKNKGKLIKTLISLLNSNEVYSRPPLDAGLMVEGRNAGGIPYGPPQKLWGNYRIEWKCTAKGQSEFIACSPIRYFSWMTSPHQLHSSFINVWMLSTEWGLSLNPVKYSSTVVSQASCSVTIITVWFKLTENMGIGFKVPLT